MQQSDSEVMVAVPVDERSRGPRRRRHRRSRKHDRGAESRSRPTSARAGDQASPAVRGAVIAGAALLSVAGVTWLATSPTGRRVGKTLGVAAKGAGEVAWARACGEPDATPAVMRKSFEELGPAYVKLAQLVASSEGLFPEKYCAEFRSCLDRVPPFGRAEVERIVREELGGELVDHFATFDEVPLASASIAQVHAATLKDGSKVVVKVQRPGLDAVIDADLRALRLVARAAQKHPRAAMAGPVDIVDDLAKTLLEELDFRLEATNLDEFNRIMAEHGQTRVCAPKPVHALTGRRVLVMERFFGKRIDDPSVKARGQAEAEEMLLLGLRAWFQCMVHHGFFHGDVHAGNLMALDDGRIGFLDFGIVGRFTRERRSQVMDFLLALAAGDYDKLAATLVAMGSIDPKAVDMAAIGKDLADAFEPVVSAGAAAKYADLLPAILRTARKNALRMPRDFVLVTKQMLYFDRYAKVLAPKLNIFRDPRVVTPLAMDAFMAMQAAAEAA